MNIAIVIIDGMAAIDALGPYEMLSRLPDANLRMVASTRGERRSDLGSVAIVADATFEEASSPDPRRAPAEMRKLASNGLRRARLGNRN